MPSAEAYLIGGDVACHTLRQRHTCPCWTVWRSCARHKLVPVVQRPRTARAVGIEAREKQVAPSGQTSVQIRPAPTEVPMPPSVARDMYVVGKLGSYLAPTVKAVDEHLSKLRRQLPNTCGAPRARLLADIDALLDKRRALQKGAA